MKSQAVQNSQVFSQGVSLIFRSIFTGFHPIVNCHITSFGSIATFFVLDYVLQLNHYLRNIQLWRYPHELQLYVSSANIHTRGCVLQTFGKIVSINYKQSGPNIEPWGIPHDSSCSVDKIPFTQHLCVLSVKYDLNNRRALPLTPQQQSLRSKMFWTIPFL